MIYAFLNQKGGVGKTTLSIHAAAELSRQKRRVLLIDADPQGSALAWANCREKPTFNVVGMPKATIHKEIDLLRQDYDEIIVDGPPRIAELARSILLAADLVVIPLLPSPLDVWAAAETVDLYREAQVYNQDLKCCLAVNRKIANTAIGRDVRKALKELEICHTHITELLRNGVTLPEAQKLARHSDIKQTMKYTHIGIEDQARAVAQLPPKDLVKEESSNAVVKSERESALQMRCIIGRL